MSKIQVNEIVNHFDTGAPDCPKGLTVTGFSTFTGSASFSGDVSIGGTLTYEDVTNIDSVGVITARSGIHVIGAGSSVGIGTSSPIETLHVNGTILSGGDRQATLGASYLDGYYQGEHVLNTFGSQYSSAKTTLGFAVRPKEGSEGLVSSSNFASIGRAVVDFDANNFEYRRADSQSIAIGNDVGLTTVFRASSTGNIQRPQQCYVALGSGGGTLNFTGSGTTSYLPYGNSSTYTFIDRNGDWDISSSTFTAPVDGIYQFNIGIRYSALTVAAVTYMYLICYVTGGAAVGAANGGQRILLWSPGTESSGTYRPRNLSGAVYMTQGQQIQPQIRIEHTTSGSFTLDSGGPSQTDTFFDIYLVG